MTYRILVTGTRHALHGDHGPRIEAAMIRTADSGGVSGSQVTLIHGGARGVDDIAWKIASKLGWKCEIHGADWKAYGRAAGPIRNARMVSLGADVCLAFPLAPPAESKGTKDCISRAQAAGIPTVVTEL